jgi:hypothetical protein
MACEIVFVNDNPIDHSGQPTWNNPKAEPGTATVITDAAHIGWLWGVLEIRDLAGSTRFKGFIQTIGVDYSSGTERFTLKGVSYGKQLSARKLYGEMTGILSDILTDLGIAGEYPFPIVATGPRAGVTVEIQYENETLVDLLNKLAGRTDASWFVNSASGEVEFKTIDRIAPTIDHTIILPPTGCQEEADVFKDIRYSISSPDINRVTVLGVNADMQTPPWPDDTTVRIADTSYPIYPADTNQKFPLLPQTTHVLQVEMVERGGFSVEIAPATNSAVEGTTDPIEYTVTVIPSGPFAGPVGLTFEGEAGIDAVFSPASIDNADGTSTLTLTPETVWDLDQTGQFRVTARSADLRAEVYANIEIEEAPPTGDPYYEVSVDPFSRTIYENGCVEYTVTITPFNGYTGTVDLSLAYPLPSGTTHAFAPSSVVIADGPETSILTICDTNVACITDPDYPPPPCEYTTNFRSTVEASPGTGSCPPSFGSGAITLTATWVAQLLCGETVVAEYGGVSSKSFGWNSTPCSGWSTPPSLIVNTPYGSFDIFAGSDGCAACN